MRQWLRSIGQFFFNSSAAPSVQRPAIEQLESRQFLSVSTEACCLDQAAPAHPTEAVRVPLGRVIDKYKGTIQTNLRPRPFKATINITAIAANGRITGTISIPFIVDNFKFSLKGTIRKSDGTFNFSFKRPGISGRLTGEYNADQHLVGEFSATSPAYGTVTGNFDFHKI